MKIHRFCFEIQVVWKKCQDEAEEDHLDLQHEFLYTEYRQDVLLVFVPQRAVVLTRTVATRATLGLLEAQRLLADAQQKSFPQQVAQMMNLAFLTLAEKKYPQMQAYNKIPCFFVKNIVHPQGARRLP